MGTHINRSVCGHHNNLECFGDRTELRGCVLSSGVVNFNACFVGIFGHFVMRILVPGGVHKFMFGGFTEGGI